MVTRMPDTLEVLPEDWHRALAVIAHPDDMEYGSASAVARWTNQGKDIRYALVTSGEAGISSMPPSVVGPAREAEQTASCAAVGVTKIEFLGLPDGLVEANIELRRHLAAQIRKHQPEVLLSINFRDSWGGPSWNHPDHRAVGVALLDAARDAANPWLFDDLPDAPWEGVRFVAFGGSPQATHGTDITDTIEYGIESLRCHELYLDNLGPSEEQDASTPVDQTAFLREAAEASGPRLGVELAATFEVVYL